MLSATKFGLNILKSEGEQCTISFEPKTNTLSFDRRKSGNISFHKRFPSIETVRLSPNNGTIKLHVLVDQSVVEMFANDGEKVITDLVFPQKHEGKIELFPEGGQAVVKTLRIQKIE